MKTPTQKLLPIQGLEVVGRGVYLRPNQPYELKAPIACKAPVTSIDEASALERDRGAAILELVREAQL